MQHNSVAIIESPRDSSAAQGRGQNVRLHSSIRLRFAFSIAGLAVLLAILVVFVPGPRESFLKSAGRTIAVTSPAVAKADIIVVAVDVGAAGTLEAADLVQRGVSNQVAVFEDPPGAVDLEFIRRGLPYENRGAISDQQLRSLGVHQIVQIPRASGSNEEGKILPAWCEAHGYRSVVLVTSRDHSRRLTRILRRSMRDRSLNVRIVSSPYSTFNPDTWWTSRAAMRIGIQEFEKLLLDVISHPFS